MSIQSVTDSPRIAAVPADPSSAASGLRASIASPAQPVDASTQQPKPLRFPWLSRLSEELGSAAKQPPSFASAPVLGDNVDKAA